MLSDRLQDLVQVQAGDHWNGKPKAETEGDPVAQSLTQFSAATLECLVTRPDALKSGDFTPIGSFIFNDLLDSPLHRFVNQFG